MDNLTHTLTGLALSRAGLNRYYARAGLVLMLAANAPDIDVIVVFSRDAWHTSSITAASRTPFR